VLRKLHNGLIFAVSALLIYLLFVNILSLADAQTQRWYAGYYYAGREIMAPWGVSGKIYTIDPVVPSWSAMAQWVTVILSYRYSYWLQVGYDKTNSLFHPTYITYYWECVSQRGSYTHQHFSGNPSPAAGSWHSYTIVYAQSSQFPERWILGVDFGTPQTTCDVYPYNPEDLQAFVETTYSRIRIDGSHFKDLSRYTGQGWPYWDRHIAHADNPYSVQPIWRADCGYNCEFKAAGGG
jgi:hypothetical protein